jgi:hypothetical protein
MQQAQMQIQERERLDEVEERRSLFNMESSIKAYNQAVLLLANHINDRTTWIKAGRLLRHAKALGDSVSVDAHKRVLEFNRLEYRDFFSQLIEKKSPAFFYGVDDPVVETGLLDLAAKCSTMPVEDNGSVEISSLRYLAEESLYAIWEAGQWPANYDDPLNVRFTEEEKRRLLFDSPGMLAYLEHRERYSTVSGVLTERSSPDI